jgi:6-phosphogluconolactonase
MSFKQKIIIKDDPSILANRAIEIFVAEAGRAVDESGRFAVALSGGSTPREMNKMLAEGPYRLNIPWRKTHIFWVDERCVPQDSRASNFGVAKKDFITAVPIPETQVHPMKCESSPRESANKYEQVLRDYFSLTSGGMPRFDLIYLGIGTDGHTASLFPGHQALNETEKLVTAVKGGKPNVARITMTLPLLNQARHIVFLIVGTAKARTIQTILEDEKTHLPAQKIRPLKGEITWLLDRSAASLLAKEHACDKNG